MEHQAILSKRNPLRFQADWGTANLTRSAGWLAQWVWKNTPDHLRSVIHTGRGMGDNIRALADGEVDIALATPASFSKLAQLGTGPFAGRPMPQLRALAVLPHEDAMIAVVRAEFGFNSLADASRHDGPLRISLGVDDPDGFMGFAGDVLLKAAGISTAMVISGGGSITRHEMPFDALADMREGRADIIIAEAIMTPDWQQLAAKGDVTFLSLTQGEQRSIKDMWGLDTLVIPPGRFPGQDRPLTVLDYSGWIVATTDALPDQIAELVARAVISDSGTLEAQYRHLSVESSALTYPIDFRAAQKTPIALHRAAAIAYAEAGTQKTEGTR